MMELQICNRDGAVLRSFALGDVEELIVGRDEHCDIRIMAQTVSREHCAIEQNGSAMVLRDLGSSGGTYVGGDRVDSVRVTDGLEAKVGPAVLKFLDGGL